MMNGYFDNAAQCRPFERAAREFAELSLRFYGNQEASGAAGVESRKQVEAASAEIAEKFAPGSQTLFTGTGTDAIRCAVRAHFMVHPGTAAVTTRAEHPALLEALRSFAGKVEFVTLRKDGSPDMAELESFLAAKPSLFAVHHVNAETGFIQDAEAFRKLLKPGTAFLLDTVQSVGKIAVPWREAMPDFVTVSGCKIGAPCGGALVFRDNKKTADSLHAVRGKFHGTGRLIPAAAVVLARVLVSDLETLEDGEKHAESLRNIVLDALAGTEFVKTAGTRSSPYILHLIFPGKQGAILVRILNSKGISAAAGSACLAETPEPSHVLRALGYSKEESFCAFRASFWRDSAEEDVRNFAKELVSALKSY